MMVKCFYVFKFKIPILQVNFFTPNVRHPQTPKTPLLRPFYRSQSFTCPMKTPYRTPKTVRRAPPPDEDDRILGTPDYIAPEILQKKPHGECDL